MRRILSASSLAISLCASSLNAQTDLTPAQNIQSSSTSVLNVSQDLMQNQACRDFLDYAQNEMPTSGLVVYQNGRTQIEMYANGATDKTKVKVWSISKFLSGLMLGAQVRERGMGLFDETLVSFGLDRKAQRKDTYNNWGEATVRHVWNMSSGLNWCEYSNCAGWMRGFE